MQTGIVAPMVENSAIFTQSNAQPDWQEKVLAKIASLLENAKKGQDLQQFKSEYEIIKKEVEKNISQLPSVQALSNVKKIIQCIEKIEAKLVRSSLNESVIENLRTAAFTAPDFITFAFSSGLVYQLLAFKTAFNTEAFRLNEDNAPQLCIEGKWKNWNEVKEEIAFDPRRGKFYSLSDESISWTFVSEGFIQKDRTKYETLFPVGKLTEEHYRKLYTHATKELSETEKGEKRAILQCYTTKRGMGCTRNGITENFYNEAPTHIGLRLIAEDGTVYSLGLEVDLEQLPEIQPGGLANCLTYFSTVNARVAIFDYEEPKKFHERSVTSLPITQRRMDEIIEQISKANNGLNEKNPARFSFAGYNCTSFGKDILKIGGYSVDTTMTLEEGISRMLPSIFEIPYFGKPLQKIVQGVKDITASIFKKITPVIPAEIKNRITGVVSALNYIPMKIYTFLKNCLMLAAGSYRMTPFQGEVSTGLLPRYPRIIRSFLDMFDESITVGDHSQRIVEWQKGKMAAFTKTYNYETPNLYGLLV